ncbi:hypothetical protein RFI_16586, partial [Reticulomyxa filosa]
MSYDEELEILSCGNDMPQQEASEHYLHIAQTLYTHKRTDGLVHEIFNIFQKKKSDDLYVELTGMIAFKNYIPRILGFANCEDETLQSHALQTLAFISLNRHLHKPLFKENILNRIIHFLKTSK